MPGVQWNEISLFRPKCRPYWVIKVSAYQLRLFSSPPNMRNMFVKLLVLCIIATAVVCNPIEKFEEDDDIPVYTEKVSPAKPTKPGQRHPPASRVPRFESKKLASNPKKHAENIRPDPYVQPSHLNSEKPITYNARPAKRIPNYLPNTIADNQHPVLRKTPRREYNPPQPKYEAPQELGVHYVSEELPREHHRPADDYTPRRLAHQSSPDYGTAAGNEPKLRYLPAPQRLSAAPATYSEEYGDVPYDEKPQPYIFGYELKDENGSMQSRKEQGDDYGNKRGSYGYTDGHGIYREVQYVADAHGFRAVVKTNEPGTESQNPADVEMISESAHY